MVVIVSMGADYSGALTPVGHRLPCLDLRAHAIVDVCILGNGGDLTMKKSRGGRMTAAKKRAAQRKGGKGAVSKRKAGRNIMKT
jgi:hypothetical protein